MTKHHLIYRVHYSLIALLGSIPGIFTLFVNVEGPFQRPQDSYLKALIIGIPSILFAVSISIRLLQKLWKFVRNKQSQHLYFSLQITWMTLIGSYLSAFIGWESNWLIAKVFNWGGVSELQWFDLVKGIPIVLAYCFIPCVLAAILCGLFSFLYLQLGNEKPKA
jgi:hypothetical protein